MQTANQNIASKKTVRVSGRQALPAQKTSKQILVTIFIVLDATESMHDVIAGAIKALIRFTELFFESDLVPVMGLVIFRDETYGEKTQVTPLGTDPEIIREILRGTRAEGGGDEPESSLPAIAKAITGFKDAGPEAKRILLHVTDASTHDPESGNTSSSVLSALKQGRIIYYGCAPAIEPYKSFANATGGTLFPLEKDIDSEAFKDVLLAVARHSIKTVRHEGPVLTDDAMNALRNLGLAGK